MKILIASPIDPAAIEELRQHHGVICAFDATEDLLQELIVDCTVLVFRSGVSITTGVMESAPALQLLVRAGIGIDNLHVEYAQQRGLTLVRIPEPGAEAVAEMSFALMLALSRNLLEADRSMRQGHWAKYELAGYLLKRKTLGIVGVGNTGTPVGEAAVAWGMEVIGCVERPSPARAAALEDRGIRLTDSDEVISTADYVSIHVPLKESTRNLIDAGVLDRMKPESFLINLGRAVSWRKTHCTCHSPRGTDCAVQPWMSTGRKVRAGCRPWPACPT